MEENDAMEGKKLEIAMFEQKILDAIQTAEEQNQDTATLENGVVAYEIKIEKVDKKIKIHAFGEEILTLEEGDKFTYNLEGLRNIQEKLKDNPDFDYKQFGLPDIEHLEELEKQEDKEKEENQKDEKDLSDDLEEKEEDEPEEKEKEEDEHEKEKTEDEKQKNNKKKNLVKLNDKVFKVLIPTAKNYSGIYLDTDTGEFVGKDKKSHEIETLKGLSLIKGANSNKPIHGMDNGEHKHINAYRMYQIDNRPNTGFAILRDGTEKGNFDVKYTTRRVDSNDINDFAYVDIPLLASQTRIGEERAKDLSGINRGLRGQGEQDKVQDELDELNEEIEVPEEITNSFNEEMDKLPNGITSMKEFKEMLYEIVEKQLDEERPNDFPDSHKSHARQIVDAMVDENKGYEQAKDELYNGKSKEMDENEKEDQKVRGQDPRK